MQLQFTAVREPAPGPAWVRHFESRWPSYRDWFRSEGDGARPSLSVTREALVDHMPELVPVWETLSALAGGGAEVARMLGLWCPTPFLAGCSQLAWTRGEPALLRNYDYHPERCDGLLLYSEWLGEPVVVSSDCLWGALDGMNARGLAAALAFGGTKRVGVGFGIPLILRYVLEVAGDVPEAIELLKRLPCNMSYSVSLVDRAARRATVHLGPGREGIVDDDPACTNHQLGVEWPEHAELTRSVARKRRLDALDAEAESLDEAIEAFTSPPLMAHAYPRAFGTLYTAVYRPASGQFEYRWPRRAWHQSLARFVEGVSVVSYPVDPRG